VLNQVSCHEYLWGSGGRNPRILNPGCKWSSSRPGCFTPNIHCIGGLVGPRAGMDAVVKREIRASAESRTAVVQSTEWMSYPGSLE